MNQENILNEMCEKIKSLSPREQIDFLKQVNGLLSESIRVSKDYVDEMKQAKDSLDAKRIANQIKG